jgi:hypothetical protein
MQGVSPSYIMSHGELVVVTRQGATTYIDGKPVKAAGESFDFRGSVQPLNGRDLLLVPEGDRFKEQFWFYTSCRILVNDLMTRCAIRYQTQTVEDWGSYRRARLMRIDVGPNATP